MRHFREIPLWKDVDESRWNDWYWQVRNRVRNVQTLKSVLNLTSEEEEGIEKCLARFRMAITPYYLTLMSPDDPTCPIRKQGVLTAKAMITTPYDMIDPLAEDRDSPEPDK